jgi:hypothetical protein
LVQDSFSLVQFKVASAVQGCSSLVWFGLVWFKIPLAWFKVALVVVQGAFIGAW